MGFTACWPYLFLMVARGRGRTNGCRRDRASGVPMEGCLRLMHMRPFHLIKIPFYSSSPLSRLLYMYKLRVWWHSFSHTVLAVFRTYFTSCRFLGPTHWFTITLEINDRNWGFSSFLKYHLSPSYHFHGYTFEQLSDNTYSKRLRCTKAVAWFTTFTDLIIEL